MKIKYLLFALSIIFFVSACTKISETEIGTGLIPPVDGVVTKDTNISIDAKNWSNTDTVRPSLYDDHALGYINDPLFGKTTASLNVQLLPSFPYSYEVSSDSLTLDSVVLALDVRGVWGDTTQPLSLHVKELDNNQSFVNDTSLIQYNNTTVFTAGNDLTYNGVAVVDPRMLNDSFHVYEDSGVNMLRIRLTDEFGNRLLKEFNASQYDSTLSFKNAFTGFQVTPDAVGNALLKIGLATTSSGAEPNTKLGIYYTYKSRTVADSTIKTVRYFTINTSNLANVNLGSAHSNSIVRDRAGAPISAYYPKTSDSTDSYVYLQASPGTYATITIDSAALGKLPNLIIHRAEIVMEQAPDNNSNIFDNLTAPYVFLAAKTSDTSIFNIPGFELLNLNTYDAVFSSGSLTNYAAFGGVPLAKTNELGQSINYYNFNVTRYIQGIVTKKNPQYSFKLFTPYREYIQLIKGIYSYGQISTNSVNSAGIGRVRLYGSGNGVPEAHRMKLHIVYSIPH